MSSDHENQVAPALEEMTLSSSPKSSIPENEILITCPIKDITEPEGRDLTFPDDDDEN